MPHATTKSSSVCSVLLFATPWTVACKTPLSMEFSRQEYWSGLSFPTPGVLPDSRIEPTSLVSPALAGTVLPGKSKSLRAVTKDPMCYN